MSHDGSEDILIIFSHSIRARIASALKIKSAIETKSGEHGTRNIFGLRDMILQPYEGEFGVESYQLVSQANHLFSISADHTARQHKLEDRAEVRKFEGHADWILSLAVHSSSELLATGAFDGNVRIWKLEDGSQVADFVAVPASPQ